MQVHYGRDKGIIRHQCYLFLVTIAACYYSFVSHCFLGHHGISLRHRHLINIFDVKSAVIYPLKIRVIKSNFFTLRTLSF